MSRKSDGNLGEQQACDYLKQQGLQLVEANFSCDIGEIDLVMQDQDTLVFVEVKYRANENLATVVEQISENQCRRIRQVAQFYLIKAKYNEHLTNLRFDVVAISGFPYELQWLPDAF